ncbi:MULTISPECIES: tetratricopeptide repeat protein [unclassified Mucilaginibacter]|uniref:tetratricopeptide repeat protein n=1 Tax=unclassified Mucilaginibacter TaxID=2617802 RepID=UPI000968699F|nr:MULTISPECIES: hypothetical protein [unclassified Mucilaginibacter]OJW15252.1 MAG: hypothetical protein BGO48_14065 [Mucilaginibacter sp. 44-25]PLW91333.1 MAG: hypothetical protein C0154_01790 [Mucilaginibacter sp.]HEK20810.1 hypothetical protein [Bacteroidota bacterium]
MKYLAIILILAGYTNAFSQSSNAEDSLIFDHRFTKCERRWVALEKKESPNNFLYGFIYIDRDAGFTFDLKGSFKIENGRYINDTSAFKGQSLKYRIEPNWRNVALIPQRHFKDLNLPAQPAWISNYYSFKDSAAYYGRIGWIYNDLNEPDTALHYLKIAHAIDPDQKGISYEMAYAYNVIGDYPDAAEIMELALVKDPGNLMYYKELGYAYMKQKDYERATEAYLKGFNLFTEEVSEIKGEFAFNIASIYHAQGKEHVYKIWMMKAKKFTPPTSSFYHQITDAGF